MGWLSLLLNTLFFDVTVNGIDLGTTFYINKKTKIGGACSLVDKNEFETKEGLIIPLNAPSKKISLFGSSSFSSNFEITVQIPDSLVFEYITKDIRWNTFE